MSKFRIFSGSKCRAVDAHNGGVEAQNGAVEGLLTQWSQIRITLVRSRLRIRIKVKSWIRIWIGINVILISTLG